MKTAIAFLALATIASASVVVNDASGLGLHGVGLSGLGYSGLGYSGLGYSGLGYSGLGYSGLGVAPVAPWALSNGLVRHAPTVVDIAPVPTALHAPVVALPQEAVSVNANRGSVHVAPLPGHAVSSSQLNLAPAPGTL